MTTELLQNSHRARSTVVQKRYAIAGTGVRGMSFANAILNDFPDIAALGALYDPNLSRMKAFSQLLKADIPCYQNFDQLVSEDRPDTLIICTPDSTHDQLIELAFQNELDVIVEKPLTTTLEKVGKILRLEKIHQRRVTVAFNCRYMPLFLELKKLLMEKPIGEILSVNLDWSIDRNHGAEYFRRWHGQLSQSGGLLVHKSSHHFDLINWLLDDTPTHVHAFGSLQFFGPNNPFRGSHCRACDHRHICPLVHQPDWEGMEPLYFQAEHEDGYLRDRCVFRKEIDIFDTMNASVRYQKGAQLGYSLVAYSSSEGLNLSITGTNGRIETEKFFRGSLREESVHSIRIATGVGKDFRKRKIEVPPADGAHSGGDIRMFEDLFCEANANPWNQKANSDAGVSSCLIGIMANQSIVSGKTERIPSRDDLT